MGLLQRYAYAPVRWAYRRPCLRKVGTAARVHRLSPADRTRQPVVPLGKPHARTHETGEMSCIAAAWSPQLGRSLRPCHPPTRQPLRGAACVTKGTNGCWDNFATFDGVDNKGEAAMRANQAIKVAGTRPTPTQAWPSCDACGQRPADSPRPPRYNAPLARLSLWQARAVSTGSLARENWWLPSFLFSPLSNRQLRSRDRTPMNYTRFDSNPAEFGFHLHYAAILSLTTVTLLFETHRFA